MRHILHSNVSEQLLRGDKKKQEKKDFNSIKILIRQIQNGHYR
jgi:hypothetical protein